MSDFQKVALRQQAIFIPEEKMHEVGNNLTETTSLFVANLAKLGFGVSEPLLRALNQTTPVFQAELLETFRDTMGVGKNWTPLVKGWNVPTGESVIDHIVTFFVNAFQLGGTRLACGHIIPEGTFPLERYNGCPFCGTPFEFGKIEKMGQGSKLRLLNLWHWKELDEFFADLLQSKTALDATQVDSLKILLAGRPLPEVAISMKETTMTVIETFIENGQPDKAALLLKSPTDILRYLWYKHTGFLQIVEPKVIVKRAKKNNKHIHKPLDTSGQAELAKSSELKLKYGRKDCVMVAGWLNNLPLEAENACEIMHPKRGLWVRFIRALRLAEYSKRPGFERLKKLLDVFYNETYPVWQRGVNHYRLRSDADKTFELLKQRPGLFARSLFSNMLWFGPDKAVAAFAEVIDKVPARLVFTLNMYAENYFNKGMRRSVKPLGGMTKSVDANQLLGSYTEVQLKAMKGQIEDLCILAMRKRFAAIPTTNKTMYIDPYLYKMPVAIGDRSESVQDLPVALMGARFPIEGDSVRLFMQWGNGLPAQHMDMDLSCRIAFPKQRTEYCSYSNLVSTGCKHSGDIRAIPDQIGTAEYIEIVPSELRKAGALYVTFTCNAYSNGALSPNMVVGWMNSKHPMTISAETGVAYDPSCVQHQVRITQTLTKGLIFGVLDVAANEIVWLEMPFQGQVVHTFNQQYVEDLLAKLNAKLSIGNLLEIKAEAQGMELAETGDADEVYTMEWGMNAALVTRLLVD